MALSHRERFSALDPHTFLGTLCLIITCNPCSSLKLREHDPQSHKTTLNVFYMLISYQVNVISGIEVRDEAFQGTASANWTERDSSQVIFGLLIVCLFLLSMFLSLFVSSFLFLSFLHLGVYSYILSLRVCSLFTELLRNP